MKTVWSLQDAKNNFSAVVDAALGGIPQKVTRRGKAEIVVIAANEYERLQKLENVDIPRFADMLLSMPQDNEEFYRQSVKTGEINF